MLTANFVSRMTASRTAGISIINLASTGCVMIPNKPSIEITRSARIVPRRLTMTETGSRLGDRRSRITAGVKNLAIQNVMKMASMEDTHKDVGSSDWCISFTNTARIQTVTEKRRSHVKRNLKANFRISGQREAIPFRDLFNSGLWSLATAFTICAVATIAITKRKTTMNIVTNPTGAYAKDALANVA